MANECHETRIIEVVHGGLLLFPISGFIWWFARVDSFVRYKALACLRWCLPLFLNMGANCVHLMFWEEVHRVIERRTGASRLAMAMMEVTVHGNVDVTTIRKRLTKTCACKACGTMPDQNRCTGSQGQWWLVGGSNEVGGRGRCGQGIFRGGCQKWGGLWCTRYWSTGTNLRNLGGLDSFVTQLKRVLDPLFDFHIEYIKPLHGNAETMSEWLLYSFVLWCS